MKTKKFAACILALTMTVSLFAGCTQSSPTEEASTADTTAATAAETEATELAETETEPELPADDSYLKIAVGELANDWNPAFAVSEGDLEVSSLIHASLLTVARDGRALMNAADGVSSSYLGAEYSYGGIANISSEYDAESDKVTYTIQLKSGVTFSDGTPMTADDVIFTYYLLCDPAYDGPYVVNKQQILGMEAYQKNNSAAPGITVTSEEINALLESPTEELKNTIIEQITRPVLEEERTWCEENWQKYVERGYGDSAEAFFATLYTYSADASYSIEGKSMDDIVNDTVNLYGMNYNQLAKNYQGDSSFFDAQVRKITENLIYQGKVSEAQGVEVPNISGIAKVDDSTVTITCLGYSSQKIYNLCNIAILPLHHYGSLENYNYENNQFGLTRGDLTAVKEKAAAPLGAGPYQLDHTEDGAVYLTANANYYAGPPANNALKLVSLTEEERLPAILDGSLDMARISLNKEETTAIGEANGDGSLNGAKVITGMIGDNDYYYFGINASLVKVGTDASSEQSLALRKAFAVLMAANRASVGEAYFGGSAEVLNYSYTTDHWAAVNSTTEGYSEAFAVKADGSAIYTEGQSAEERAEAAKAAAVEYLIQAGYTYDEAAGRFTAAPEGGKLEFTAMLPSYFAGDTGMANILNQVKSTVEALGLTLNIQEIESLDEFVWLLSEKSVDFWAAERSTSIEPQIIGYYHSAGNNNYYGLNNASIDETLSALSKSTASYEERAASYQEFFRNLREQVVEIPAYQRQDGVIYHAERIEAASVQTLSGYYNWTAEVNGLQMK